MYPSLENFVATQGDKAALLPIRRLEDVRQDIQTLTASGQLNSFQRLILNDIYRLDLPETGFEIRSILIVASPSPAIFELVFHWQGRRIPLSLPASYTDKGRRPGQVETYLQEYLGPSGYHVQHAPQLPHKLLAVRSGLGRYGRNNICYVEGMGSFLNLVVFYSDIPCAEDSWQEIKQLEVCRACRACLHACPTAAILPERFLIDNERCLTYFNESGGWDFPDWIVPSAHNAVYGCMRCQVVCPADEPYLRQQCTAQEFSEEETLIFWQGSPTKIFLWVSVKRWISWK